MVEEVEEEEVVVVGVVIKTRSPFPPLSARLPRSPPPPPPRCSDGKRIRALLPTYQRASLCCLLCVCARKAPSTKVLTRSLLPRARPRN